ncbi:MAG TPA: cytochrome c biogenesis protein CcsA [Anaeromyxobacteraceae bacterium]|nr:cytochrome c biogenesis protein CcsA [Anaeromyxobacteraceae bacterium]
MSIQILRIAALCYAGAAVSYLVFFARPRHLRAVTVGQAMLSVAFVVHAVAVGVGCSEFGGREFFSMRGGLAFIAFLAAGAYLLLQRFYRIPSVGAFVTPLIVVVLLPALFGTPGRPEVAPETLRQPTLTVHIFAATGGVAVFALAAGVALMYLLQEREVKGKRFGALFSRLPSLDTLDRLTQRLVRAGFLVFSVALVTGALVAKGVWKSAWSWDPQQVSSLVVWLLYGGLVQLRHTGWHGRRYAWITVAGFLLVIGSMVGLGSVPGATRHGGTYQ